jgi:hypothetical protein
MVAVQDLNHLLPGGRIGVLTSGNSMAAGNTVTDQPPFGAPGSDSEAASSEDIMNPVGPVEQPVRQPTVMEDGRGHTPVPTTWTRLT